MRAFALNHGDELPVAHQLERRTFDTEWQLESWLLANPDIILNEQLLVFGRQYSLDTGLPDLLALDRWGNVLVTELKKGQSGSGSASEETILSQPQNYAQSLSRFAYEDLEDIYDEFKRNVQDGNWEVGGEAVLEDSLAIAHESVFGKDIDRADFNQQQRMVILAEEITRRTEDNARYLLEQGLNVQCVSVQWFAVPEEHDRSVVIADELIVATVVVDYPRSRVQPKDDKVDYSNILLRVRDRVFDEVAEITQVERPEHIHRSGSRQLGTNSNHPAHPDTVRYRFKPRIVEEGTAVVSIGVWGGDEDEKDRVREVVAEYADELDGFETSSDYRPNNNLIYKRFEITDRHPDGEVLDEIAEELAKLIKFYHPKFVEEIST